MKVNTKREKKNLHRSYHTTNPGGLTPAVAIEPYVAGDPFTKTTKNAAIISIGFWISSLEQPA